RIELFAFGADRLQHQALHGQISLWLLLRNASVRSTQIDRIDLVLKLVEEIVKEVKFAPLLSRIAAFLQEVNRRTHHQVPRLSFLAITSILTRQTQHAYDPWQREPLQNHGHQNERERQKDNEAPLRKRTAIVERQRQRTGRSQCNHAAHSRPAHHKGLVRLRLLTPLVPQSRSYQPCGFRGWKH